MQTKIKMQFDPEIAKKIGMEAAVMYANIEFWCAHNEANDKNFFDGNYWTYNSQKAYETLFPFWTRRQIQRILKTLEENGYIKIGNYNSSKYDQTNWYCVIYQTVQSSAPNGAMDGTEQCNQVPQTVLSNIKTDNNTDSKPYIRNEENSKEEQKDDSQKKKVPLLPTTLVGQFENFVWNGHEDIKDRVLNFAAFVDKELVNVMKLKHPLTPDQACELIKDHNKTEIVSIFRDMENKANLNQKYNSAYKTFKGWKEVRDRSV